MCSVQCAVCSEMCSVSPRDDREEQEYFGLCEVQVFPLANGSQCGEPEVTPLGSLPPSFTPL